MEVEVSITLYGSVQPSQSLSVVDADLERGLGSLGCVASRVDHSGYSRDDWTMMIELELEESLTPAFRLILEVLESHGITSGVRFWVSGEDFTIAEAYEKLAQPSPDWWN